MFFSNTRMSSLVMAVVFITTAGQASASGAAEWMQEEAGKAYREAYKLIIEEKWRDSIKAFQDLTRKYPGSDWVDDAQFWICFANEKNGIAADKTFDCYQSFVQAHPRSEWLDEAKMNMVRLAGQLAREGKPDYEQRVKSFSAGSDVEIQTATLVALLEFGDQASAAAVLDRVSRISNEQVRSRVVRMLGDHTRSPAVAAKLGELARKDASARVRRSAVSALAESKTPETVAILKEIALSGDDVEVRKTALRELGDMEIKKEEIIGLLQSVALSSPTPALAEAAVHGLSEIRGPEAFKALQAIYRDAKPPEVRRAVLRAVADREDDQAAVLQFLSSVATGEGDPGLRSSAIHAIGDLESPEALEKLKSIALSQSDYETRRAALRAIGEFDGDAVIDILATFLRGEKDPRLRRAAAQALGETGKDKAVPVLSELARSDADVEVKKAAVKALSGIGTPAARDALIRLLDAKDKE